MSQRFSINFQGTNQNVSGMAYWPLSPCLRYADVTITMPLTLARQEGRRATKSTVQVIPFTKGKRPVLESILRVWQRVLA